MPKGKGTYGSQVGRPTKKKYKGGGGFGNTLSSRLRTHEVGMVDDPFSTKNPEGIPAEQIEKNVNEKNEIIALASEVDEPISLKGASQGVPTANAQERSQTFQMGGNVLEYKEGGKV